MTDPFSPPATEWTMLDPNYLKLKRLMIFITWPIFFAIPALVLGLTMRWWWTFWIVGAILVVWLPFQWWRQGRRYRLWGYAEMDTDLYIRKGWLWRRLTIVPYGRMQVVEVEAGPFQRAYKLATVKLVTASIQSDAEVPGLNADAAAELRDRLSERGSAQQAGL